MSETRYPSSRRGHIIGWGKALPERVLTNDDLAAMVDTSDEWIRQRTGITERRVAGEGETTFSLSFKAAQDALRITSLDPIHLDLIIVATVTPDYPFPATACLLQDALGAQHAAAFDLQAGCSGFVYGVSVAAGLLSAGLYRYALVVGAETLSRITDWTDRTTCVLFGDGAGAVVLESREEPGGILSSVMGADGSGGELLMLPGGGSVHPTNADTVQARRHFIQMKGQEVFRFATRTMPAAARQALEKADLGVEDVALFVPHQANDRILQTAAKRLGVPDEKMFSNLARYGNTSAASIPIALCEAIEQERIKRDDVVVLTGFGAGLTWAAAVVRWSLPFPTPLPRRRAVIWRGIRFRWARLRSYLRRLWRGVDARLFHLMYERDGRRKRRDKE